MASNERRQFLVDEVLTASRTAACARAGIYKKGVTDTQKEPFKRGVEENLIRFAKPYQNRRPGCDGHLKNIEKLSKDLTQGYFEILVDDRFRIGIAQKALNLFLKYLWCMDEIQQPPHCPFDSIVLDAVAKYVDGPKLKPWTQMDDPDEYRRYVEAAERARARRALDEEGVDSLAEWELRVWAERPRG